MSESKYPTPEHWLTAQAATVPEAAAIRAQMDALRLRAEQAYAAGARDGQLAERNSNPLSQRLAALAQEAEERVTRSALYRSGASYPILSKYYEGKQIEAEYFRDQLRALLADTERLTA